MDEEKEGSGQYDRAPGGKIRLLRKEHGKKGEKEYRVPNVKEKALETISQGDQPKRVIAQSVKENG
jgi:hypothetical protein